ncbi:DNA-binding proteins Bright/BRCAA1/RBP1 and proteins containing BRIGHT domain [Loxospora ochrophaea]|nr:DNA-binding proteins Bright/BRCAA1/RBP1 and proteins containing BRIGHT domain [Loxospora ochrophaea]
MAPAIADSKSSSSIAMALAGKTASVNIPKPCEAAFWAGKDSFAAVAARSLPTAHQSAGLPTPPNSISPSLPPQAYRGHASVAPATPPAHVLDSDIDLQDAVDHANAQDRPQRALAVTSPGRILAGLDTTGAITPGLLAKHYLPDILLTHGPLAIRHVMGYLTTSVPGFSGIPPAKARRLVVGALEGRGSSGEGGGLEGDVEFEKVGWGRWDALRKGHTSKGNGSSEQPSKGTHHPSPEYSTHNGVRISNPSRHDRHHGPRSIDDSAKYSHDSEMDTGDNLEDISMLENEADKMSLDGSDPCSSSEAPDDGPVLDEDLGDVTDEEDWASIGAAALRQGSFPLKSGGGSSRHNIYLSAQHVHSRGGRVGGGGGPASSALAKSTPVTTLLMQQPYKESMAGLHTGYPFQSLHGGLPDGFGSDDQEREAVEALVRLSSV